MEYYSAANSWESRKESPAQSKPENQKQEKSQKVRGKYTRIKPARTWVENIFKKYWNENDQRTKNLNLFITAGHGPELINARRGAKQQNCRKM
jgi:hypothetical protein